MFHSVITGSGCYIPPFVKTNQDFAQHALLYRSGIPFTREPGEVVSKFKKITGIEERRYTTDDLNASNIGFEAAKKAIEDSGVDPETLDQLIVAHNFGNVIKGYHSDGRSAFPGQSAETCTGHPESRIALHMISYSDVRAGCRD